MHQFQDGWLRGTIGGRKTKKRVIGSLRPKKSQ